MNISLEISNLRRMQQFYKGIVFSLLLLLPLASFGQIEDPLQLETQSIQTAQNKYDLIFTVSIDPGWSTYSQKIEGDMDFEKMNGP